MIPSSNLLNQAFGLIAPVAFDYYRYLGRTANDIGLYQTAFLPPVQLRGSVQAVPRSVYQEKGLDFQKRYVTVFVSADLIDIERGVSGDQIAWRGKRYQLTSETDWYEIDGWVSILAVEIGVDIPAPSP